LFAKIGAISDKIDSKTVKLCKQQGGALNYVNQEDKPSVFLNFASKYGKEK